MDYFDSSVTATFLPEFQANAISQDSQEYDYSVLADTYTPKQIDDFRKSAIDPELVLLNCKRLYRQDDMIRALRKIDSRNKTANGLGMLSQFVKRQPIEWTDGGVGFWGYADDTPLAVQVKPNAPRKDKKGTKSIKYESPLGTTSRLMIPRVTREIWERISARVNVPIGDYTDYRDWLIAHPQVPTCTTEGFRKVMSHTSAGYAVIGFAGIENWSIPREHDWDMREPIPDLVPLLAPGRHFTICYDCDQLPSTVVKVNKAVGTLSKMLLGRGCTVNRATWDNSYKGIDDLIFNCGAKILERVIAESKPITLVSIDSAAKKPPENMVAEVIAKEYKQRLIYCSELKEWFWYEQSGKWIVRNSDEIDAFFRYEIEKQVPNYGTSNYVNNVINAAKSRLLVIKWREASSLLYTPFQNGVLNLKTFELEPYKPEFYFRWQLSYNYNLLAKCDIFEEWLLETMGGDKDKVQLIRAYIKAVITGRKDLQRYMEFIGVGGSGKSTLINVTTGLIGIDNCCFTDLVRIETDKFEAANYVTSRLIVITDSDHYVGGVSKLKAIVGGDIARSERKYKDAIPAKTIAMVLIAANEAIKSTDYTSGLARKRISVPFDNLVPKSGRRKLMDVEGDGSLTGEFADLLPGIYNWAIGIDEDVMKNLIVNTDVSVPSLHTFAHNILLATNPLANWVDDNIIFTPGYRSQIGGATEIKVSQSDGQGTTQSSTEYSNAHIWLYANYRQWYISHGGAKPISLQRFRELLYDLCAAQLHANVQVGRDRDGSYMTGLKIRSQDDKLPRSITGGTTAAIPAKDSVTDSVMDCDGLVMDFIGSGYGCDGCDGLSLKSPQSNDDDVVPQHHQNSYTNSSGKTPKIRQNPPTSSPEPPSAVTTPSQLHHSPSHPSPEPLSAVTTPSQVDVMDVKIGDRVKNPITEKAGVVVKTRVKTVTTPKRVYDVAQCLVDFEGDDPRWLDANVLVLVLGNNKIFAVTLRDAA